MKWRIWVRAFPGLGSETRGTHGPADWSFLKNSGAKARDLRVSRFRGLKSPHGRRPVHGDPESASAPSVITGQNRFKYYSGRMHWGSAYECADKIDAYICLERDMRAGCTTGNTG